jgi:hypothetical protein
LQSKTIEVETMTPKYKLTETELDEYNQTFGNKEWLEEYYNNQDLEDDFEDPYWEHSDYHMDGYDDQDDYDDQDGEDCLD